MKVFGSSTFGYFDISVSRSGTARGSIISGHVQLDGKLDHQQFNIQHTLTHTNTHPLQHIVIESTHNPAQLFGH